MKRVLLLLIALSNIGQAQTQQQPLLVTRIYGVTSAWAGECAAGVLDNRSTISRSNNYHSVNATGSGTWSVAINYSDTACTGPWTSFGAVSAITQASNPPIAYGNGYHKFIQLVITGNASVTYSAAKDFFLSSSIGSVIFPCTVAQGCTNAITAPAALVNLGLGGTGFPSGDGAGSYTHYAAGSQLQYLRRKPNTTSTQYEFVSLTIGSTDYDFPTQTPGGSLIAGGIGQSITLTPCPLGVKGADSGLSHFIYLSGGTGTAEATLITGGTCTSGASTGTVTVTPANAHSGAWTVTSATAGIQEAISTLPTSGGTVYVPAGAYVLRANVSFMNKGNVGLMSTYGASYSGPGSLPTTPNGNNVAWYGGANYTGSVVMLHSTVINSWTVFKPDGSVLDLTGSTTQGWQEAVDYAHTNGFSFWGFGGQITATGTVATQRITCTTPVSIKTSDVSAYMLVGVDPYYDVANGANAALDFITFDTFDIANFTMLGGQIIYPGNAAGVRIFPVHNNGESFIGGTTSKFFFHTIAVVDPTTLAPDGTHGTGLRISADNGVIINTLFDVHEINGGLDGIVIDNPVVGVVRNHFRSDAIHNQGRFGIRAGTSALTGGLISGNVWDMIMGPQAGATAAFDMWGDHDMVNLSIGSGLVGVRLNSSADQNRFNYAFNIATAPFTTTSNTFNWINGVRVPLTRSAINFGTCTSPCVVQNPVSNSGPMNVLISGGTVSAVAMSADGSTYDSLSSPSDRWWPVLPGGFLKITFSVAPTGIKQY